MQIELLKIDLQIMNENDWMQFHAYRKHYHIENTPDDPYFDDTTFENIVRTEFSNEYTETKVFEILEVKNDLKNIIGILFTQIHKQNSPSYKGNEQNLMWRIELAKNYRGKGIGTQVLNKIVEIAEENGKTMLITNTNEEDGKNFLKAIGSEVALSMRENRLYMKNIDWAMLESWKKEGEDLNNETELKITHSIPNEVIENYAKTFTFAGNQAPRDNLATGDFIVTPEVYRKREEDNRKAGFVIEIGFTLEKDGTVSGLTEMMFMPSDETVIRQNLTAVLKEHRGRKLGKWLKASMLLHVKTSYPNLEYIVTTNAESNAPMLAINEKLGFKKHKEMIGSQITLEELQNYLVKRKKLILTSNYDI